MKQELLRRSFLIFILFGALFSLGLISYFSSNVLALSQQRQANTLVNQVGSGLPFRLKIPSINVDSIVEYVGITEEGAMDVPKDIANAGWYDLGPRPGENGSAVIAGHYGWKNGMPAAFDNLSKLQRGDQIYVEDETGAIITFVVREIKSLDPKADVSAVFSSNDRKAHLNLVTCEGVWDKTQKSYSKRLVVFADRE